MKPRSFYLRAAKPGIRSRLRKWLFADEYQVGSLKQSDPRADALSDLYEDIGDQIKREEGLTNNRLTWILQANGFLFTALALIKNDDPVLKQVIPFAIGFSASVINLLGFCALGGAFLSIWDLRCVWKRHCQELQRPRPFGGQRASILGFLPVFIPLLLFGAWVYIGLSLVNSPGLFLKTTHTVQHR
jgi:hypothetical protein